jgi:hypothetical protein
VFEKLVRKAPSTRSGRPLSLNYFAGLVRQPSIAEVPMRKALLGLFFCLLVLLGIGLLGFSLAR